jgi:hypothetical protein
MPQMITPKDMYLDRAKNFLRWIHEDNRLLAGPETPWLQIEDPEAKAFLEMLNRKTDKIVYVVERFIEHYEFERDGRYGVPEDFEINKDEVSEVE